MFERMKFKTYLITVFSVIIVLAAVITLVGTVGLLKTKDSMQGFMDKTLDTELAVKTSRIEANIAARNLREMVIIDNPKDYKGLEESIETIHEQISILKEAHGETDGLAKKYEDAFQNWFNVAVKVIDEVEKRDNEAAKDVILNECSPALSGLAEIAKEIDAQIAKERAAAENYIQKLIMSFIASCVVLLILLLFIGLYCQMKVTKNITGVTNKVKEAVLELSKGNLKARIEYEARNEFGELAERMNKMWGCHRLWHERVLPGEFYL